MEDDVGKLKNAQVSQEFILKVANCFEALTENDVEDINSFWEEMRDGMKEACEQILGTPEVRKKELINEVY